MKLLYIMIGGAMGAMLRYGVGLLLMKKIPNPKIPTAMLIVNLIGSFCLGFLLSRGFFYNESLSYEEPLFLFLGVGVLGAFTTYSTFTVETLQLLRDSRIKEAMVYVSVSIVGCLGSFSIGFLIF